MKQDWQNECCALCSLKETTPCPWGKLKHFSLHRAEECFAIEQQGEDARDWVESGGKLAVVSRNDAPGTEVA